MPGLERLFTALDTIVDEVHGLFDDWRRDSNLELLIGEVGADVIKLAVHEWIANLIQHADFAGEHPLIRLVIFPVGDRIRCVIDDNSRGFELDRQIVEQQTSLDLASVPPERGRGLLLLAACTESLSYGPIPPAGGAFLPGPLLQRLEFSVRAQSCLDDAAAADVSAASPPEKFS